MQTLSEATIRYCQDHEQHVTAAIRWEADTYALVELLLQGRMQHERDEGHQQKLMLTTLWAQISDFHQQDEVCPGSGLFILSAFGTHVKL